MAAAATLFNALILLLASQSADALGRFAGGGAHFNVGAHFNAARPIGAGEFRPGIRRPEFQERFPDVHPYPVDRHYYPRYWPYPGPHYWAGAAAGAAVGAAAAGSWIYSLPPDCESVSVDGITYERCGSAWYRPHFTGAQVAYETVEAPR